MENPYLIVLQEEKEVTKEYHQLLKQGTTNEDRYVSGYIKRFRISREISKLPNLMRFRD
ncbi:hypothetical protein [Oceanobacillus alkalisoli]|uniref:hypothetical protein n=1 Tax=Oceanobacillus alkalisoli TaxID=2925113 RepID=UPI001F11F058|nr:hypothetical protein [Oceanobacillus alkalisoli]MCF3944301.1 hypothetical protein [Oceanobacillus alkalisoli]